MARIAIAFSFLLLAAAGMASVAEAADERTGERPTDLAAQVEGIYHGDVISDARSSSREGVTVTLTRVGPDQVEVSSDYSRIPTVRIRIERAMSAIVQAAGDHVFLIQRDSDPNLLNLTIDDASLAVRRR